MAGPGTGDVFGTTAAHRGRGKSYGLGGKEAKGAASSPGIQGEPPCSCLGKGWKTKVVERKSGRETMRNSYPARAMRKSSVRSALAIQIVIIAFDTFSLHFKE